jgi:hypothetical protein
MHHDVEGFDSRVSASHEQIAVEEYAFQDRDVLEFHFLDFDPVAGDFRCAA